MITDKPELVSPPGRTGYHLASKTGTWGFIMALPLVALYEWGVVVIPRSSGEYIRNGAEVWMRAPFQYTGIPEAYIVPGLVALIGLVIFIRERKKRIALRPKYAGYMIAESAIYAAALPFVVLPVTSWLVNMSTVAQASQEMSWGTEMVLSIGAGIYEELLFRVILVGGLFWLLQRVFSGAPRWLPYTFAAIIGALLFSYVHYIGPLGDTMELGSFTFRAVAGLVFNIMFLVRGFGVAAWTHALYDVYVISGFFN